MGTGSIAKASFPEESMLNCQERCFGKIMEKETCFVSITPSFASGLMIKTCKKTKHLLQQNVSTVVQKIYLYY